jgi:dolichol-phosphate mannosyltransferase
MDIAVILPTYNEAANIGRMVETLYRDVFPSIPDADLHLVVVDDNSPDGTGRIVRELLAAHPRLHLLSDEKQGLGHAYVRGFRFAMDELQVDALVEMDADFQHDPRHLKAMVAALQGGADYVIGSRFASGGSIPPEWEWYRKAVSVLGNRFARAALGLNEIQDLTTGFRLTRVKGVMDRIDLEGLMALGRFAYKVDLLYKTIGLSKRVVEIPIRFAPREKETSKFQFVELIATCYVLIRLRWARERRSDI